MVPKPAAWDLSGFQGRHTGSYKNAQNFPDEGDVHRETYIESISMARLLPKKQLCIVIIYKNDVPRAERFQLRDDYLTKPHIIN